MPNCVREDEIVMSSMKISLLLKRNKGFELLFVFTEDIFVSVWNAMFQEDIIC